MYKCWTCGYEAEYAVECPNCTRKELQQKQNNILANQSKLQAQAALALVAILSEANNATKKREEKEKYDSEQNSIPSAINEISSYLNTVNFSQRQLKKQAN